MCVFTGDRFTAIKMYNWLFIIVHMPCSGTDQRENLYRDILLELQVLVNEHYECNYCLIGGAFNIDLNCNSSLSQTVNVFICLNKMNRCDVIFPAGNRNTHFNDANNSSSAIVYMVTTSPSDVIAFNILDMDTNSSDHSPIMALCACDVAHAEMCDPSESITSVMTSLTCGGTMILLDYITSTRGVLANLCCTVSVQFK